MIGRAQIRESSPIYPAATVPERTGLFSIATRLLTALGQQDLIPVLLSPSPVTVGQPTRVPPALLTGHEWLIVSDSVLGVKRGLAVDRCSQVFLGPPRS